LNSEIRIPKIESNPNDQNPKVETTKDTKGALRTTKKNVPDPSFVALRAPFVHFVVFLVSEFGHSDFGIDSDSGIREHRLYFAPRTLMR